MSNHSYNKKAQVREKKFTLDIDTIKTKKEKVV